MFSPARIYSLDIETDNSEGHGLNPELSRVTEVAVLTAETSWVFDNDDEAKLLTELGECVRDLRPGLISTWNGAFFDMPFLSDRMIAVGVAGLGVGPRLVTDPGLKPKYEPLPGHAGGYIAVWPSSFPSIPHQHLDISGAYKQFAADADVSWSLKPVCKAMGIDMFEIDRTRLHEYTPEEVRAYVLSDCVGTRELALHTLGLA